MGKNLVPSMVGTRILPIWSLQVPRRSRMGKIRVSGSCREVTTLSVSAVQPVRFSNRFGRVRFGWRAGSTCRFGGSCRKVATLIVRCGL